MFPGGIGAEVMAGGTVLRGPQYPGDILHQLNEPLTQAGFRGLVGVGLRYNQTSAQLEPTGYFHAGWDDWLHWELALCEVPSWASLMDGSPNAESDFLPEFTTGIVVSQPPWPSVGQPVPPSVELAIQPQFTKNIFFHDIMVSGGKVFTAGVDGLIGVARGTGRSLGKARGVALAVAGAMAFPERQARVDVGASVETVLVALEEMGWW
jgi:hypothetical protein